MAVVVIVRLIRLEVVCRVACDIDVHLKLLSQEIYVLLAGHVLNYTAQNAIAEIRVDVLLPDRLWELRLCQDSLNEETMLTVLASEHRVQLPSRGWPRAHFVFQQVFERDLFTARAHFVVKVVSKNIRENPLVQSEKSLLDKALNRNPGEHFRDAGYPV